MCTHIYLPRHAVRANPLNGICTTPTLNCQLVHWRPFRSMIFAAHPLSTTDPSSKWVSPCGQAGTMQAYARLPGSSSSSPGGSYSYAEPDMCSESNFDPWSSLWCSPQQPPKSQVVATVNPKATHWTTSDVATPSSASSYSIPTPLSAMGNFDAADHVAQEEQDFDEFDYDDDDEDDECAESEDTMMNSEQDPDELSPASQPVPRTIKPTALDDQSDPTAPFAHHYPLYYHSDTNSFARVISDRKMTASAPDYPSASHHLTTVDEGPTWFQREQLSHSSQVFPETPHLQSPQHVYGGLGISSLPIGMPSAVALRHPHPSYYSSAISCTNSSQPIPIMQPQPIRPIPPIPLDEFASSAIENSPSDSCAGVLSSRRPQTSKTRHPARLWMILNATMMTMEVETHQKRRVKVYAAPKNIRYHNLSWPAPQKSLCTPAIAGEWR
ncbi:hypothetical protein EDD16DRAFT_1168778 [Pisolithus croceorrhizus]|nr:hypothetical protein EDD16DRAFT_1168778 [Pisolithus croceorrhizus]